MQSKLLKNLCLRRFPLAHTSHSRLPVGLQFFPIGAKLNSTATSNADSSSISTEYTKFHRSQESSISDDVYARHAQAILLMGRTDGHLTLGWGDFPYEWKNGRHPDDLKLLKEPLKPYFQLHPRKESVRMWFRVSFKVDGGFLPASFMVDTGAPSWLYVTDDITMMLRKHGRYPKDDPYSLSIADSPMFPAFETPWDHLPASLIGIELIQHLGLTIGRDGWKWTRDLPYW